MTDTARGRVPGSAGTTEQGNKSIVPASLIVAPVLGLSRVRFAGPTLRGLRAAQSVLWGGTPHTPRRTTEQGQNGSQRLSEPPSERVCAKPEASAPNRERSERHNKRSEAKRPGDREAGRRASSPKPPGAPTRQGRGEPPSTKRQRRAPPQGAVLGGGRSPPAPRREAPGAPALKGGAIATRATPRSELANGAAQGGCPRSVAEGVRAGGASERAEASRWGA